MIIDQTVDKRTGVCAVKPLLRLTAESFRPYGHVGRAGEGFIKSIRNGSVVLSRPAIPFEHDEAAPDHALEFYQVQAEGSSLRAIQAERHPHSAQMFIPMAVERYLVVVWKEHPQSGCLPVAFVGGPEDVVVYRPGIWHHGIVALGKDGVFASTMWKTRGGVDVEFLALATPQIFDLTGAGSI